MFARLLGCGTSIAGAFVRGGAPFYSNHPRRYVLGHTLSACHLTVYCYRCKKAAPITLLWFRCFLSCFDDLQSVRFQRAPHGRLPGSFGRSAEEGRFGHLRRGELSGQGRGGMAAANVHSPVTIVVRSETYAEHGTKPTTCRLLLETQTRIHCFFTPTQHISFDRHPHRCPKD